MIPLVLTRQYTSLPPFCEKEVLRYAGCREERSEVTELMHKAMAEAEAVLSYRLCYCRLPVTLRGEECDFGAFSLTSRSLSAYLSSCGEVVVLAATVGVGLDRLIARYSRISPARACMLQAVGAERIEALCDYFCAEEKMDSGCLDSSRFSPGYGDLSLSAQKKLFSVLECEKRIGLCLNDSLLMSPSKSVTAFVRLREKSNREKQSKCQLCPRQNCEFRGAYDLS